METKGTLLVGVREDAHNEMEHTDTKASNAARETQIAGNTENQDTNKDQPDAAAEVLGEHLEILIDNANAELAHQTDQRKQEGGAGNARHSELAVEIENAVGI